MKKILAAILLVAAMAWSSFAGATCSNYTTYTDGQVLTASSLNSLQTNYTNCVNAVLDGDTITGTINLNSGADLNVYSDTGSALKASIDGATGALIAGITSEGYHDNCGISNSGTTLSLHAADGSSLSATNPCIFGIRSNTAGRTALAYFTANQTLTHGAASDSDGNLFGISDFNWANTMPMFGGVVYDGTTPYIVSSRLPFTVTGAAATAFCQKGDTDCDAQLDMMIWTTGLTLASWVNLPVTQMFWFDATYATAGGAWAFAVTTKNGFNQNYAGVLYTMPSQQNGAEASKVFTSTDGATALTFAGVFSGASWSIEPNGWTTLHHAHEDQSVAGADATQVRFYGPFLASMQASTLVNGVGRGVINNLASSIMCFISNGLAYAKCEYTNPTAGSFVADSSFANTNDFIYFTIRYPTLP